MSLSPQQQEQEEEYQIPYQQLLVKDKLIAFPQKLFVTLDYICCLEHIVDLVAPYEGQAVLDAGCGEGRLCGALQKNNVEVHGMDYSRRAVAFARLYNPDIDIKCASLTEEMPYPESFFQEIILIETLEHIEPKLLPEAMTQLKRILKPGGRVVITVPHKNRRLDSKHYQHFDHESMAAVVSPYFEIEDSYGFHRKSLVHQSVIHLLSGMYYYLYPLTKLGLGSLLDGITAFAFRYFRRFVHLCGRDEGITLVCLARKK